MIHLFCGYEEREAIGYHVFVQSVVARSSVPVAITALASRGLPYGSNAFTRSRFLVPELMKHQGHAIFCDASDMLMLSDIAELDALFDSKYAVQCVKHDYKTRHPRKYVGTPMECDNRDYARKNQASVMIVNCAHPILREEWKRSSLEQEHPVRLLQFRGIPDELIGELPSEWNVLADESQEVETAKLLHFTAGLPCFEAYRNTPGAERWFEEAESLKQEVA